MKEFWKDAILKAISNLGIAIAVLVVFKATGVFEPVTCRCECGKEEPWAGIPIEDPMVVSNNIVMIP